MMGLKLSAWEKQLDEIEVNRRPETPSFDPVAAAAALLWVLDCYASVAAGKASLIPVYGPPREPTDAKRAALQLLDSIAARLTAGGP
jgi:hypothetical protein